MGENLERSQFLIFPLRIVQSNNNHSLCEKKVLYDTFRKVAKRKQNHYGDHSGEHDHVPTLMSHAIKIDLMI